MGSWTEQLKQLQFSSNYQVRQRRSMHQMTSDSLLDMTPVQKIALACHGNSSNIMLIHSITGSNIGPNKHQYDSFLIAENREYIGRYAVEVRRVALRLMEAILEGLGLDKEYLQEKFQEGLQLLSVNSYPKLSHGDTTIGLASHSDYGFLTILLTSCQGLEVLDRNSNSWKTVQQHRHALHVHIGDHMEVLSNGHIKTVVHRALLNPEEVRISIASIHGFAQHEKVACAKELLDEENPQKYKESSFGDFLDHLMANMDNKHRNFLESLRM